MQFIPLIQIIMYASVGYWNIAEKWLKTKQLPIPLKWFLTSWLPLAFSMTIWLKPHPWPEQYHWDNTRGIQFPRVDTGNVAKYIREIQLSKKSFFTGFGHDGNLRTRLAILVSCRNLEKNEIGYDHDHNFSKDCCKRGDIVFIYSDSLGAAIKNDCNI